jgi:hypothetical protein
LRSVRFKSGCNSTSECHENNRTAIEFNKRIVDGRDGRGVEWTETGEADENRG